MKKVDQCLKDLGSVYQGCEAEISELVYQIDKMLSEKQLDWEISYNRLFDENKELHKVVSNNNIELKEKDIEINDLQKEIMIINKSNYDKHILLESKIAELSLNNHEEKYCMKCRAYSDTKEITDIDKIALTSLKKECNQYIDKIAELEIQQTTHNAQIKLLEEQRSTMLKKNEELKQKFSKCRKEYHSKLQATDNEIKLFSKQKEKYEASISNLKSILKSKDDEIHNMKRTLEDVLSSNQKNNSLFSNMKNDYDSIKDEKEILVKDIDDYVVKLHTLENENGQLLEKVSAMIQDAEFNKKNATGEIELLKAQLEIYQKENSFLQKFLIQHDRVSNPVFQCPTGFLEKLEADNHSLKDNIANMEKDIAGIVKFTEESISPDKLVSSSIKTDVLGVKEGYEKQIKNTKAEVEELYIANSSLKTMNGNFDKHGILSDLDCHKDSSMLDSDTHGSTHENSHNSPSHAFQTEENIINSITASDTGCSITSNPITDEFAELQRSVLKKFEAKLNECVSNFNSNST